MRPVAIVPARGGSKRIPMKNVRPLAGVPILARVLRTLWAADVFDRVVVSTDDDTIRDVALGEGAEVPFRRSAATSGDEAPLHAVVVEALDRALDGLDVPALVCVLPTAVLLEPSTLAAAAQRFETSAADSMLSVQRYPHPIARALGLDAEGFVRMADPAARAKSTAAFGDAYFDAGQFYFVRPTDVRARTSLVGDRCLPFELGPFDAQDIDTESDWHLAEFKLEYRRRVRGQH